MSAGIKSIQKYKPRPLKCLSKGYVYAFFMLTELKKEEEECRLSQSSVTHPSGNACQDASHPYYDVARHGILQVAGNKFISLSPLMSTESAVLSVSSTVAVTMLNRISSPNDVQTSSYHFAFLFN